MAGLKILLPQITRAYFSNHRIANKNLLRQSWPGLPRWGQDPKRQLRYRRRNLQSAKRRLLKVPRLTHPSRTCSVRYWKIKRFCLTSKAKILKSNRSVTLASSKSMLTITRSATWAATCRVWLPQLSIRCRHKTPKTSATTSATNQSSPLASQTPASQAFQAKKRKAAKW